MPSNDRPNQETGKRGGPERAGTRSPGEMMKEIIVADSRGQESIQSVRCLVPADGVGKAVVCWQ